MKKIPIVLYAGETEQEGTHCGVECIRRMDTAIEFVRNNRFKCASINLGAGIRPDKPHYPQLKEVMRDYLQNAIPTFPILTSEKDGWGTFRESLAVYDDLKFYRQNEIYVCSSWYHIPRILLIWFIISKGTMKVHVISAPSPRLSSIPTEILSFGKVFVDWYKLRKVL